MRSEEYKCCLCDKQAESLVVYKTFTERRNTSTEYKFYCSDHYSQYRESEINKQLNSKEVINTERLRYLLGHIGTKASWNDFLEL